MGTRAGFLLTGVLNIAMCSSSVCLDMSKGESRLSKSEAQFLSFSSPSTGEWERERSGTLAAAKDLAGRDVGVKASGIISPIVFASLLVNIPFPLFGCDGVGRISLPSSSALALHLFNLFLAPLSPSLSPLFFLFTCLAAFPHGFLTTGPRSLAECRYSGSPRK